MPIDLFKLLGFAIQQGSPFALSMYDMQRREKRIDLDYARGLDELRQMKAIKIERGEFEEEDAPKTCSTCRVGGAEARDTIGSSSWDLLHNTAHTYPKADASSEVQSRYRRFMMGVIESFPCEECSDDMLSYLAKNPLDFSSRRTLERSLCQAHNHVRKKLHQKIVVRCA